MVSFEDGEEGEITDILSPKINFLQGIAIITSNLKLKFINRYI